MNKPPYRVPLMSEINALPDNGYCIVSTFSGCGGSCLGFKMAGYQVLWANEFIPAAQETYRANHKSTYLSTQDIRTVKASDIRSIIGDVEIDVLEGSPPCASFSTAGKREKGWGKVKAYSDTKQRTDDLFFEYARLLKDLQPRVFVAENVSGLVKGTAKGYFIEILQALKACGYNVEAKLLDAQWLGVPQMRQRIIFVGVRNDLKLSPVFPKPLQYRYSVRDALPWIVKQGDNGGFSAGAMRETDQPSPTIGTGIQAGNGRYPPSKVEAYIGTHKGERSIDAPAPAVLTPMREHTTSELTIRQGNKNSHSSQRGQIVDLTSPMPTIIAGGGSGQFDITRAYRDKRGAFGNDGDITNQPAPTVLSDSVGTHWIVESETDICPYAIGAKWDALPEGGHEFYGTDFHKTHRDKPCPTVTQRGGDSTTASVTHPTEKRKFSIAELKRICAFPDDFILTGTYAQQWERLGRAVPPVMMYYVARTIQEQILCKIK